LRAELGHLAQVGKARPESVPDEEIVEADTETAAVIDLRTGSPVVAIDPGIAVLPRTGYLAASRWQLAVKRAMDVVVSGVALVVLAPLFVVITVAVLTTSRGGLLYKQDRIGQHGEMFRFWKFRSMRANAHEEKSTLWGLNEQDGPIFKIRKDPRVTRVGRILRRLSLDELPQLVHVFTGRMSLVGPRPHLPEEVAAYSPRAQQRLAAKPGITCIWQVSGRSDLDFETWIDLDLEYVHTWNLRQDLRLLAKTVPAVVSGRGAY
jgi:lipopolysaccharide/colanic/teichoic acid biosynthesis glycosyltransferase